MHQVCPMPFYQLVNDPLDVFWCSPMSSNTKTWQEIESSSA
ncbi:MAG: hypothetical protein QME49_01435 [bacterium]|nr:hypothetical protein [bacterium]